MAKSARSIFLDDNLTNLVNAHRERTGASFAKIVTAALCQYLLSEPHGPDDRWMRAIQAHEDGNIGFGQIPTWVREQVAKQLSGITKDMREEADAAGPDARAALQKNRTFISLNDKRRREEQILVAWQHVLELADDPVEAIAKFWQRVHAGYRDMEVGLDGSYGFRSLPGGFKDEAPDPTDESGD